MAVIVKILVIGIFIIFLLDFILVIVKHLKKSDKLTACEFASGTETTDAKRKPLQTREAYNEVGLTNAEITPDAENEISRS